MSRSKPTPETLRVDLTAMIDDRADAFTKKRALAAVAAWEASERRAEEAERIANSRWASAYDSSGRPIGPVYNIVDWQAHLQSELGKAGFQIAELEAAARLALDPLKDLWGYGPDGEPNRHQVAHEALKAALAPAPPEEAP